MSTSNHGIRPFIEAVRSPLLTRSSFSSVPGTIVAHSPAESGAYIGSPALLVMPDGSYVASHDFFGPGTNFDEYAVYRSHNRGRSWRKVAGFVGQWWSSLFYHRGALYTIGTTREYGFAVIRKSDDGGVTWTEPTGPETGILSSEERYHCAPVPVVEHGGRLWTAFELALGKRPHWPATVASAPLDADLLKADSWQWADPFHHFWSGGQWIEGNIVVVREEEVVNILRANVGKPDKAAVVHVSTDGRTLTHDPERDLIDFPGGGVKFTIRFDPVSGRYWTLGNRQKDPPANRNTLVLASSEDILTWRVELVVLHHDDAECHAFQYVDWVIDGDDILFLSRTAHEDGLGGAPRGHDANFLTFHRIRDFRRIS